MTEEERQQHQGFMQRSGLDPEVGFLMKSEKFFTVTDACIAVSYTHLPSLLKVEKVVNPPHRPVVSNSRTSVERLKRADKV